MAPVGQQDSVVVVPPQPVKPDVPFGPSSIAALVAAVLAGIAAVVAFVKGDRSEQTLGVIAGGVVAVTALVAMITSRTVQAKAQITAAATSAPVATLASMSGTLLHGGVDDVAEAPPLLLDHELGELDMAHEQRDLHDGNSGA